MADPPAPGTPRTTGEMLRTLRAARTALSAALAARDGVADGQYCQCAVPDLASGLMCRACHLRHQGQEVAAVHRLVDVHTFVPGRLAGLICKVCTQSEQAPRHHGTPAVGRTSWGTTVQGVCPPNQPVIEAPEAGEQRG